MKGTSLVKTKQITYQNNDPVSFITALIQRNPQGGSITLDEVCQKVPHAERKDIVKALKESNEGVFVVGRKGHASRWLYGDQAEQEAEAQHNRQQVRRIPRQREENEEINNEPPHVSLSEGHTFTNAKLKITVGGKQLIIPLNVALVQA